MDRWLINTGICIAIIYAATGWLLWLWWNHIYTRIDWEAFYRRNPDFLQHWTLGPFSIFYLGDLRKIERKVYWDMFIRDKATKLMFGYVCAVLYFALV